MRILSIAILSCLFITCNAQEKRLALIIGNGDYSLGPLANPVNDARSMKLALEESGFEVIEHENLDQRSMKQAIDNYGEQLRSYDIGLFYYAGHGIQSRGYNYLIPVNVDLKSEQHVEYDCVMVDRVLSMMETSRTKVNIIILDACRNNPFERSWSRSSNTKGLAFMDAPQGTLIAYATSPGSTASDGTGSNGLYTEAILENLNIPGITILQMFQNVRNIVALESNKEQIPWESTSLTGDFYFNTADNERSEKITPVENQTPVEVTKNEDPPSGYKGKYFMLGTGYGNSYGGLGVRVQMRVGGIQGFGFHAGAGYFPNAPVLAAAGVKYFPYKDIYINTQFGLTGWEEQYYWDDNYYEYSGFLLFGPSMLVGVDMTWGSKVGFGFNAGVGATYNINADLMSDITMALDMGFIARF